MQYKNDWTLNSHFDSLFLAKRLHAYLFVVVILVHLLEQIVQGSY